MLKVDKISKSFMQRGLVLNGLSLEVSAGDSIAIMGPSGSGKTTLMNLIGLLDKPDSGEIVFKDNNISKFNDTESANYRNKNIGFVFQDHLLLPHLTVSENIHLPMLPFGYINEMIEEQENYIQLLMEKSGIVDLSKKYPFRISGGEAQRVALVRALVNKPSLLLADEPTGSLDEKNADIMGELLMEMNRELGISLIVATHSSTLAKKMSKTLQLSEGKLTIKS